MPRFYITTPIYYVNDRPHLGHAYSTIAADVQARHRRRRGDDVFFLTGTDEHGSKVERAAAKAGKSPQALVDENSLAFRALFSKLLISNDDFIRTTEVRHKAGARALWEAIRARSPDDLYVREYEGWYCASCETFFVEKDLKAGKCPEFGHPVELAKEKNHFFRLSRYADRLLKLYEQRPDFIRPDFRFNEVKAFVAAGLEDLSISRSTVKWGIPVPGDEAQTMYVWIDALSNYLSALDFGGETRRYETFWKGGESVHLLGKDISRFHAVYWPAFLMAASLPPPTREFVHGWILKDNQKMSKSLGNTVDAGALADEFGADALRYFLMREVPLGQDGSYSDEILIERINADLANDLGNTLNRLLQMLAGAREGKLPASSPDSPLARRCAEAHPRVAAAMDGFNYKVALDEVWRVLPAIGSLLQQAEPWKLARDPGPAAQAKYDEIMGGALNALAWAADWLDAFMPAKCAELRKQLGLPETPGRLGEFRWPLIPPGTATRRGPVLFPRIDMTEYLAALRAGSPMTDPKSSLPPVDATQPVPAGSAQEAAALVEGARLAAGAAPAKPEEIRIAIDDFLKVKLRTAVIIAAEAVEKSDKLVKLQVDLGDEKRQIVAGIRKAYAPESLIGRRIVVVANLKPAKLMGVPSEGMLLAATNAAGDVVLLTTDPDKDCEPGAGIK